MKCNFEYSQGRAMQLCNPYFLHAGDDGGVRNALPKFQTNILCITFCIPSFSSCPVMAPTVYEQLKLLFIIIFCQYVLCMKF